METLVRSRLCNSEVAISCAIPPRLKRPFESQYRLFHLILSLAICAAWEICPERDAFDTVDEMIEKQSRDGQPKDINSPVGCNTFSGLTCLPREQSIDDLPGWHDNLVQGKTCSQGKPKGDALWLYVKSRPDQLTPISPESAPGNGIQVAGSWQSLGFVRQEKVTAKTNGRTALLRFVGRARRGSQSLEPCVNS